MPQSMTLLERMCSKISFEPNGCWQYLGFVQPNGYGTFWANGKTRLAHRISYELAVGHPLPAGHSRQLDHLCRNRSCVNPTHLEFVAAKENTLRSPIAPAAINARKTHCNQGHPLTGRNLRVSKEGSRICRICHTLKTIESQKRLGTYGQHKSRAKPKQPRIASLICKNGLHVLAETGSYTYADGHKTCRLCCIARAKEYQASKNGHILAEVGYYRTSYGAITCKRCNADKSQRYREKHPRAMK